jgi:hypothetical protein
MSTSNFYKKNASKYFSINLKDEYDYDILKENLWVEFQDTADFWEKDFCRGYDGKVVAQIVKDFKKWEITFNIIIRNGYYNGVNLDWDCTIINNNNGDEYYFGDYDYKELPKYINDWVDKKIKSIEKVFSRYSEPLICTARFSNGEAIYQRA